MFRLLIGSFASLGLSLLADCAFSAKPGAELQVSPAGSISADVPIAALSPKRWHVFLVAADNEQPVFDRAISRMGMQYRDLYGIEPHRYSTKPAQNTGTGTSSLSAVRATIASIHLQPDDGCYFFFTSHGSQLGLVMKADVRLSPFRLNTFLDETCGARPTVVVISGCYTGVFLTPGMAKENRILISAARSDRTSFGCDASEEYTVFDRCLIERWEGSRTWQILYENVVACVKNTETTRRFSPPSEPQAFFGRLMRDLPLDLKDSG